MAGDHGMAGQMVEVHVAAYAVDVLRKHPDPEESLVVAHDVHSHCTSSSDGVPVHAGGPHTRTLVGY